MKQICYDMLHHVILPVVAALRWDGDAPDVIRCSGYKLKASEALLLGTALVESGFRNVIQTGGPALGFWQMEPATHDDHKDWIMRTEGIEERVKSVCALPPKGSMLQIPARMMVWNLRYAVCMARVHYRRRPGALPETIEELAQYWKDHYNTYQGRGTVEHFLKAWEAR